MNKLQTIWNQDRSRLQNSHVYQEFDELYNLFIKDCIAPLIFESKHLIYQRAPTLRICTAGATFSTCKMHNDREYNHQ